MPDFNDLPDRLAAESDPQTIASIICASMREKDGLLRESDRALKAILDDFDNTYDGEPLGMEHHLAIEGARATHAKLKRAMPSPVCEVCGGDCAGANPPPTYCPSRDDGPLASGETGWLVELKGRTPSWSTLFVGDYDDHWTDDSTKAIRFARKVDAEAFIAWHGWTEAFASEHIWSDARAKAVEP